MDSSYYTTALSAVIFAVVLVVFGYISLNVIKRVHPSSDPIDSTVWDNKHIFAKTLFVTGIVIFYVNMFVINKIFE